MADTLRRMAIIDWHPFRAVESIPELGIEPGDWVSVEFDSDPPVCVVRSHGHDALSILEAHFMKARASDSAGGSASARSERPAPRAWRPRVLGLVALLLVA